MSNQQFIQSEFLENLKKNETPTSVFLTNGIQLRGYVHAFDPFSICLRNDNSYQLVYKHAVSTIMATITKKGTGDVKRTTFKTKTSA